MRKIFLALSCVLMLCGCEAQHNLMVDLSDIIDGNVVVAILNTTMTAVEKTDTVVAKDGKFTYDFTGEKARVAVMDIPTAQGPARTKVCLVPGEQGLLRGTLTNAKWTGTDFYLELAELEASTEKIRNEIDKLMTSFNTQMQQGVSMDSLQQALMPAYNALADKMNGVLLEYVKKHPDSNVSASLLTDVENPEPILALLTDKVKKGPFSDIVSAIQDVVDTQKLAAQAAGDDGNVTMAPDFTLNDINGKPFKLSSLRGKYVVLDFWGSWCGYCIKGMPKMKEYYAKYKSKMEIVGIDCKDTDEKWKAAVKEHDLPWTHVYAPENSDVLTQYAVTGFPTKIVIDPQGKVVKISVGEDPAFYTALDEILK